MLRELIRDGSFGPFHWNGFEFLRRVFVTVRDRDWREVPPRQWDCSVHEARSTVDVSARHTSEGVDFSWSGCLKLSRAGRDVSFEFEGHALRSMDVCRLGIVVLHPVHMLIGSTVTTRGPAGASTVVIGRQIAPQAVANGIPQAITEPFNALAIDHATFGRLALEFRGELFELEDQRNWGDASFKTYCTPLRLGFPRKIARGDCVRHSFDAHYFPATSVEAQRSQQASFAASHGLGERALRIGRVARITSELLESPGWMLGWDHLQIDLDESTQSARESLLQQLPPGTKLHAVSALDRNLAAVGGSLEFLRSHSERISAVLLKSCKSPLPTAKAVAQVRAALHDTAAARIPLLASPNGHFVEFNRGQAFDLDVEGIAFPLSPTVHGGDVRTILENASTVRDMVTTARRVTKNFQIHLAPIALLPASSGDPVAIPKSVATAWLASVLVQAAEAGVASVTLSPDFL
jgi:hypothetical protein